MIIDAPPPYDPNQPAVVNPSEKSSSPISNSNLSPIPATIQSSTRRTSSATSNSYSSNSNSSLSSSSSSRPFSDSDYFSPPPFQEATLSDQDSQLKSRSKYFSFQFKRCRKAVFRASVFFVFLLAFISAINSSVVQSLCNSLLVYLDSFLPKFLSSTISSISDYTLRPVIQKLTGPRIATTSYTFLLIVMAVKGKAAMKEAMRLKQILGEYRFREWERRERERELQAAALRAHINDNGLLNYEEEQLVAQAQRM